MAQPRHMGWDVDSLAFRRVMAGLLVVCAGLDAGKIMLISRSGVNQENDFFGLWSFAKFLHVHPGSGIYDGAALQNFEMALRPGFGGFYPCPYPPSFLSVTAWLGWFSLDAAWIIWTAIGMACLAAACWCLFEHRYRLAGIGFVLLAPASLLNGLSGETGFFTTALLVAGLALMRQRPVLAGVAFGLLTVKPQLGVLVAVVLVAVVVIAVALPARALPARALLERGAWRTMAAAVCTGLGLVLVSFLVFPVSIWQFWLQALPQYETLLLGNHQLLTLMVTVHAGLLRLGLPDDWAVAGQIVVSAVIAGLVIRCFQVADDRIAAASLLAGCVLAAPHAFIYDASGGAVALVLAVEWLAARGLRLSTLGLGLGMVAYLSPFLMAAGPASLIYSGAAALAFFWIVWMGLRHG